MYDADNRITGDHDAHVAEWWDREMTIECIHNLYKSAWGHRPRHIDFDAMSQTELDEMVEEVAEDNRREMEREECYQAGAWERLNERLEGLIQVGAKSRGTALRWLLDADGVDLWSHDGWEICCEYGLNPDKKSEIMLLLKEAA